MKIRAPFGLYFQELHSFTARLYNSWSASDRVVFDCAVPTWKVENAIATANIGATFIVFTFLDYSRVVLTQAAGGEASTLLQSVGGGNLPVAGQAR